MQIAPALNGLERLQAWFHGYAYDWHRHDTYAVGVTLEGVQTFDCHRATYNSLPGQVIVLHPDEPHNGRSGLATGFGYRMLYIEPSRIRDALDIQTRMDANRESKIDRGETLESRMLAKQI